MDTSLTGKEKFINDLNKILAADRLERNRISSGFLEMDIKPFIVIYTTHPERTIKKLYKNNIPIYSYLNHKIFTKTPIRYFTPWLDTSALHKMKKKVLRSVDSVVNDNRLKEKLELCSKELLDYPSYVIKSLSVAPVSKDKKKKLEELLSINDIIKYNRSDYNNVIETITDQTFNNFDIDVLSTKDDYNKVISMATKSELCWTPSETPYLSEEIFRDFKYNGGTIVYSILYNKEVLGFGRNFICLDKQGKTHLFIDLIEGGSVYSHEKYHNTIEEWVNWEDKKFVGGFKAGIVFSLYLAKKIGVDYITGNNVGAGELFDRIGGWRKRLAFTTEDGLELYKLGNPIYNNATETYRNVVKSFGKISERYYSLDMKNFSRG
ncbi:MAG: hypothetical protein M1433_00265 [Candidatus Parvarchaeota archaeon]|nr:hypothetical protein [Candidatus Parvarchaeota archaeon]